MAVSTRRWTSESRRRLGQLAEERRAALGIPGSRVLRSRQTWLRVRDGETVEERTLRQIEDALDLEPLSLDHFPEMGYLAPRPRRPDPQRWDGLGGLARMGELIGGIAGNTPEEQAQVMELLERGRRRQEERWRNAATDST